MKLIHRDVNIITKAISLLLIMITGYLFIVSLFSTVYVSEYENIYYIKDNAFINLLVILVVVTAIYFLKDKISRIIDGNEEKMVIINSLVLFLILLYFVMTTRLYPLYDQAKILNVVKQLNNYDYSAFLPGGYEDRCRVQWGITLYFYIISRVFSNISISAIQILNSVYIIVANFLIYKISCFMFSKKAGALIHLALCLYMPVWFYSSFVYGTLPSFMFAILAVYLLLPVEKSKIRRIVNVIAASLSMSIAILLKTNSLIILIALVLIIAYSFMKDMKPYYIITILAILASYIFASKALDSYVFNLTKIDAKGMPKTSYIAMGLMENSDKGPGWYNGYNDEIYVNNGFDQEKANAEANQSISESLAGFKSNPANLISFVSRKIVSQWNEPTFESLYILYKRDSIPEAKEWFKKLSVPTSGLNKAVRELFNLMHVTVLFGAMCFFVLNYKKASIKQLILGVIVLGGFFFHLMWEAKSQYIIIYFVLFIVYAVMGYNGLAVYIRRIADMQDKKNIIKDKVAIFYIALALICILTALVPTMSIPGRILKPSFKTEEYKAVTDAGLNDISPAGRLDADYVSGLKVNKNYKLLGRFYIENVADENMLLTPVNSDGYDETIRSVDENAILKFSEILNPEISDSALIFEVSEGSYIIRFQKNQKVLDVENGVIDAGSRLHMWDFNADPGQCFSLIENADGSYSILCSDFALKMSEDGGLTLTDGIDPEALRIRLIEVKND